MGYANYVGLYFALIPTQPRLIAPLAEDDLSASLDLSTLSITPNNASTVDFIYSNIESKLNY